MIVDEIIDPGTLNWGPLQRRAEHSLPVVAHPVDALLAFWAPVVASPAVLTVKRCHYALPVATGMRELAPVLACAAVVLVGRQIHALVATAFAPDPEDVAHIVVLLAVVGCVGRRPRVYAPLAGRPQEPADSPGRHHRDMRTDRVRLFGIVVWQWFQLCLGDGLHCHGDGYYECRDLQRESHIFTRELWLG